MFGVQATDRNMESLVLLLISQSPPEPADPASSGFPLPLLIASLVAVLLLLVIGIFLWRQMFSAMPKFDSTEKFSKMADDRKHALTARMAEQTVRKLDQKTVSSADTVSNKSDEAVYEEIDSTPLSKQRTVDGTGDVSVSIDDTEE